MEGWKDCFAIVCLSSKRGAMLINSSHGVTWSQLLNHLCQLSHVCYHAVYFSREQFLGVECLLDILLCVLGVSIYDQQVTWGYDDSAMIQDSNVLAKKTMSTLLSQYSQHTGNSNIRAGSLKWKMSNHYCFPVRLRHWSNGWYKSQKCFKNNSCKHNDQKKEEVITSSYRKVTYSSDNSQKLLSR